MCLIDLSMHIGGGIFPRAYEYGTCMFGGETRQRAIVIKPVTLASASEKMPKFYHFLLFSLKK